MRFRHALPGLALTIVAAPLLAGCAALGLPPIPGQSVGLFSGPDATLGPDASGLPAPTPAATPSFFSSHNGYAMTLPPGWAGASMSPADAGLAFDLLASVDGTLATLAQTVLDTSGASLSMIGGQVTSASDAIPPGVAVLVLRMRGVPADEAQATVASFIGTVAGADQPVAPSVVTLPAGDANRYDLSVDGDSVGSVRLTVYVFLVGGNAIVVAFAASDAVFDSVSLTFDSIIMSLRFGV